MFQTRATQSDLRVARAQNLFFPRIMSRFDFLSSEESVFDWMNDHHASVPKRTECFREFNYFDAGKDAIFRFNVADEADARDRFFVPVSKRCIKSPMAFFFNECTQSAHLFVHVPDMSRNAILSCGKKTFQEIFNAWVAGAYKETGALTAYRPIDNQPVVHDLRMFVVSAGAISDTEFKALRKLCSNCKFMSICRRKHDTFNLRLTATDQDELTWLRREFAADRLTSTLKHIESFMAEIGDRDSKPKPGAATLTLDTLQHIKDFDSYDEIAKTIKCVDGVSISLIDVSSTLAVTVTNVASVKERDHIINLFESCRMHNEIYRPMERLILNRRYGPPITESDVKIVMEKLKAAPLTRRVKAVDSLRKMGVPDVKRVSCDLRQKRYMAILKVLAKASTPTKPAKESVFPTTQEELKDLAVQTKQNTDAALLELTNELRRMAGKVVTRDYEVLKDVGGDDAASMYTLDPAVLEKQAAAAVGMDESSSSSDSSDYSDEEEEVEPAIAEAEPMTKRHCNVTEPVSEPVSELILDWSGWESRSGFETMPELETMPNLVSEPVESTFEAVVFESVFQRALVAAESMVTLRCIEPVETRFEKCEREKREKWAALEKRMAEKNEVIAKRKREEQEEKMAQEENAKKLAREEYAIRIAADVARVGTAICMTLNEERELLQMEAEAAAYVPEPMEIDAVPAKPTDMTDEQWLMFGQYE